MVWDNGMALRPRGWIGPGFEGNFPQVITAAIGDVGLLGLRFFLWRPAQKISAGELQAVRTHDSYEHVSVGVVHDVSRSILTERVADLTIFDAPVFPG